MSIMKRRFRGFYPVILDVETGGFNPQTDALLELAAVTLKFDDLGNLSPDQSFTIILTRLKELILSLRLSNLPV